MVGRDLCTRKTMVCFSNLGSGAEILTLLFHPNPHANTTLHQSFYEFGKAPLHTNILYLHHSAHEIPQLPIPLYNWDPSGVENKFLNLSFLLSVISDTV
jgi:hypothetical protein